VPVDVDVRATQRTIAFDTTRVAKSGGKGMIQLFVSDGLNTASATVGGLYR
jgi:hypothetical protein